MRNIYFPAVLLAMILGFSLWCAQYTEAQTEQWTYLFQESIDAGSRRDWQTAEEHLREAHRLWEKNQMLYHIIMNHNELESAEALFTEAMTACEERSPVAHRLLVDALMSQIQVLSEYQAISIKNVL